MRKAIVDHSLQSLGFDVEPEPIPDTLVHYVDTVICYAPDITDRDIQELLTAGWTEEEIFEVTVAVSFGAGYGRLKIAWQALTETQA